MTRPGLCLAAWLTVLGLPTARAQVTARAGDAAPGEPHATSLHAPAVYAVWYHAAERCIGLPGNVRAVHWYVVPAPWGPAGAGKTHAEWQVASGQHRITVNAEESTDSVLVMHEAIHDILWINGWRWPDTTSAAKHPIPPFDRCAPAFYTPRNP